ncbi:UDP-N-acetylmuramoyl-L-alanine--D-glutamate ligase [Bacillus mexicanus]|uniref:UDP-N-acetylmuramoyl-L-alanine--D-glutamate ligase n=1 Tax=Bacillus mexicanus TaxID=2834415 RepID=UPI003D234D0E
MNKKYLLVGLGTSNKAVARDLIKENRKFDIYMDKGEVPDDIKEYAGVSLFSEANDVITNHYKAVIKSPGVPFSHPLLEKFDVGNIAVTNEIGYAQKYVRQPFISITGTNGKTTTTSLVEYILNISKDRARSVGNIGYSFLEEAVKGENILVTELSSFQLRELDKLNPDVSVWLNISSAHLDYHKTFEDYINAKKKIFVNQSEENLLVFNEDDQNVKEAAKLKQGKKKSFSLVNKEADAYFDGKFIWISGEKWLRKSDVGIKGVHNIQNAMAAILTTLEFASKEEIIKGISQFKGVEHRLEVVLESEILKIYNDSKSTNITAVKAALSAFDKPVVLMMGGLDRGNGYEDLTNEWSKVETLICFGQSGPKIYDSAKNYTEVIIENDIEKAILIAKGKVSKGGILLFSPGCASWDRFKNFEERGEFFKKIVQK